MPHRNWLCLCRSSKKCREIFERRLADKLDIELIDAAHKTVDVNKIKDLTLGLLLLISFSL